MMFKKEEHFSGERLHVGVYGDGSGHGYSCVCAKAEGLGWDRGSGCLGSILTEVTGAHLLHEAVGTVLHLALGADLGH